MKRIGRYTLRLENCPFVESYAAVVGKKESEGPAGVYFDRYYTDTTLGESSWEKAESRLQTEAVELALQKKGAECLTNAVYFCRRFAQPMHFFHLWAAQLTNPFLGQYGACSTMCQTLAMASVFVDAGAAERAVAVTSSHFCTAERQFRLPLEYGGQRPPTAQWTALLPVQRWYRLGGIQGKKIPQILQRLWKICRIEEVTVGRIADLGIKDANNMGAAMAPAAAQTLVDFFDDTGTTARDYDLILTGDLGYVGSDLLYQLLEKQSISLENRHKDCGKLLFDRHKQDVHAGGSGCGCAASIFCSKILTEMKQGLWKNVLFMATGALLSTTSSQQGESIPSIAHLVHLSCQPSAGWG